MNIRLYDVTDHIWRVLRSLCTILQKTVRKDTSPKNDDFFERQWDKIVEFYHTYINRKSVFIIEITDLKIRTGWSVVDKDETTTYHNTVYDLTPSYMWYGKETIFVKRGIRKPIDFYHYIKVFEEYWNR